MIMFKNKTTVGKISIIIIFSGLIGILASLLICFLGHNYGIIVFILSLFIIYIATLLQRLDEKLQNK